MPAFAAPLQRPRTHARSFVATAGIAALVVTAALIPTDSARADSSPLLATTASASASFASSNPVAMTGPAIQKLKAPVTRTPKITGTAKFGSTLTAAPGAWSKGTTFTYQWRVNGVAIAGATKQKLVLSSKWLGKKMTVSVTGRAPGFATATRTSSATAAVSYPGRTAPVTKNACPSWAPIKGNINTKAKTKIFHVIGGGSYKVTNPEECFRTERDAIAAGYRKARN